MIEIYHSYCRVNTHFNLYDNLMIRKLIIDYSKINKGDVMIKEFGDGSGF